MAENADEPELPKGTKLGPYRIERRLGAGGMGAVYLASHTGLNKAVVVKVLHAHYARSAEVRMRFVREGEAAARIRHPHVVDVTDVGKDGPVPYLVMEYLDGQSLADLIDTHGAMAPDRAVDVLLPVIDAVNAAHAVGVVHRDLKPDNLYIVRTPTGDPHPKVLDFGISRVVDESARPDHTGTAAMLGTPAYMSPEQITNPREVDDRSDQYALGVILYECLTGRQAFTGESVGSILLQVGNGRFQAPRQSRPDLDPHLEAVVLRAMAYQREDRFPSLIDFGVALLPFASPRAQMIWGTSFQPRREHGHADTQLDFAKAPSIGHGKDTLLNAVQERDTTTIPVGKRRSSARRSIVIGALLLLILLTCVGGWLRRRPGGEPASTIVAAATAGPTSPTTAVPPPPPSPPPPPVVQPLNVVVPNPALAQTPDVPEPRAPAPLIVGPPRRTNSPHRHNRPSSDRRSQVPDLPP